MTDTIIVSEGLFEPGALALIVPMDMTRQANGRLDHPRKLAMVVYDAEIDIIRLLKMEFLIAETLMPERVKALTDAMRDAVDEGHLMMQSRAKTNG